MVVHLTQPPATECWPTPMDLSASIGDLIVQFLSRPLRKTQTATCSAITGIHRHAPWQSWSQLNQWAKKQRVAHCDDWALARLRPRRFPLCWTRRFQVQFWAIFLKRLMGTPFIGNRLFWRASWEKKLLPITLPWWMMAPYLADLAQSRLMMKAFPHGARW